MEGATGLSHGAGPARHQEADRRPASRREDRGTRPGSQARARGHPRDRVLRSSAPARLGRSRLEIPDHRYLLVPSGVDHGGPDSGQGHRDADPRLRIPAAGRAPHPDGRGQADALATDRSRRARDSRAIPRIPESPRVRPGTGAPPAPGRAAVRGLLRTPLGDDRGERFLGLGRSDPGRGRGAPRAPRLQRRRSGLRDRREVATRALRGGARGRRAGLAAGIDAVDRDRCLRDGRSGPGVAPDRHVLRQPRRRLQHVRLAPSELARPRNGSGDPRVGTGRRIDAHGTSVLARAIARSGNGRGAARLGGSRRGSRVALGGRGGRR